jgi:colanic acid/amylovoran biosynthesis glycosyltransferase
MIPSDGLTVAHLLGRYLPRTQTFVYELLEHLTHVRSVVVTEAVENLDLFPIDNLVRVPNRSLGSRAIDRFTHTVSGHRFISEKRYREAVTSAGVGLLHGHFGWSAPTAVPLRRALGIPLVTTFYGSDMSSLPSQRRWRDIYRELFEVGDAFLVEGHHMKRQLEELGCPSEKLVVHHIGVNLAKIPCNPVETQESGHVTVLVCGSFIEKKGIRYAIEALAKAQRERPDLQMLIVGDGPERSDYEVLVDRLGVSESIRMLGYRTHAEYLELAKQVQIFLAPSVTASSGDTEGGAPTVLLEMQAACLPVVSTLHADIPEIVQDGQTGFLVPERDSDALALRILQLADDPELRVRMGLRGRQHVERNHDVIEQASRLEGIYSNQVT